MQNCTGLTQERFLSATVPLVMSSYQLKLCEGNNKISIVHVWGTPYEMGFAHGRILHDRVNAFITTLWDYFIDEITHELNEFLPDLPDW